MYKLFQLYLFTFLFITSTYANDFLKVSVHPSAHPYGWHEKELIKGAAYELVNLIGEELNIKMKPVILPWARSIHDVKSGKIDMVLTVFYNKQRAKDISFSRAYDSLDTSVFVAKDSKIVFNKWDDLIGLTGLTITGDSQGDKWDKFEEEKLNVIRVVNMEQVFKMIESKRADYVVFPKVSTLREIEKLGYKGKIINLPTPVISQGIHFGISKKSPYHKYLPKINQKITKYINNGQFQKLIDKAYDSIEKN